MYWFKTKYFSAIHLFIIFSFGLASCRPDVKEQVAFFDLKKYFETEATRLNKANPIIKKTISHNNNKQTKNLPIMDWTSELAMFINSDINKPAWLQEYKTSTTDSTIQYLAISPDLKTRSILITKKKNQVSSIIIQNKIKNFLYTNTESLVYIPDSVYHIHKTQQVRIVGINTYDILGFFKN